VTRLDPTAGNTLVARHVPEPLLARRSQRQMIIKQPPQQLAAVAIETLLKLPMRQASGVRPIQKADRRLELLPAGSKPSCNIAISLPDGQDFSAERVKFATTGVEIGGHVGHLRGRRWTRTTPTSTPFT
jgi:hypothetical protein